MTLLHDQMAILGDNKQRWGTCPFLAVCSKQNPSRGEREGVQNTPESSGY